MVQDNQKEKGHTLCVTTGDTRATSVGGKDRHTTLINHHRSGQYQTTISLNSFKKCLYNPQPLQQL
eukprot:6037302-Amphidinium_carterae.1